jgi:hypothetical protein
VTETDKLRFEELVRLRIDIVEKLDRLSAVVAGMSEKLDKVGLGLAGVERVLFKVGGPK